MINILIKNMIKFNKRMKRYKLKSKDYNKKLKSHNPQDSNNLKLKNNREQSSQIILPQIKIKPMDKEFSNY